jgi:ASPIC and UnbV.
MNTDAIGARILVTAGARTQRRDIKTGSSYLSQHDLRAHVGLGTATTVDRLEVRWPSGRVETVSRVGVNQIVTIDEGKGIVARAPYAGAR